MKARRLPGEAAPQRSDELFVAQGHGPARERSPEEPSAEPRVDARELCELESEALRLLASSGC
jgi:hypothetical protein